jgi:hypothetical protein
VAAEEDYFLNLREKHGWTYGAYSNIGFGKYVENFVLQHQYEMQ